MNDLTRHSQALDAEIITNPDLRARQEALNGLKQFDLVIRMVETFLDPARQPFKFRPSHYFLFAGKDWLGSQGMQGIGAPPILRFGAASTSRPRLGKFLSESKNSATI
jgi:hypothetical protein